MNQDMKERCELFLKNRDVIKNFYAWDGDIMAILGSVLYTGRMETADVAKIKACEKIVKKKADFFSDFRGNLKIALVCSMTMAEDPEAYFDGVRGVYAQLNKNKLFGSDYRILAAMAIYGSSVADQTAVVERTQKIYQKMKQAHPFLTSDEDTSFAAMLALTDRGTEELMGEVEQCYSTMKKYFSSDNAVQSLSHVLAISNKPVEEKCRQVKEIYEELRTAKRKYGTGCELATLGALAMLDLPVENIVQEICEVDDFLKAQKGFGALGTGGSGRLMYAALLVMANNMPESDVMEKAVVSSSLATVIAQQTAIMCTMAAVAVSVSSTSGN